MFIGLNDKPTLEQVPSYNMSHNDTQKLQTLIGEYIEKLL
jgi:hypothetical protein